MTAESHWLLLKSNVREFLAYLTLVYETYWTHT